MRMGSLTSIRLVLFELSTCTIINELYNNSNNKHLW